MFTAVSDSASVKHRCASAIVPALALLIALACTGPAVSDLALRRSRKIYAGNAASNKVAGRQALVLDQQSGLVEYLRFGLLQNAGLKAAYQRWRAALERVVQLSTLPDPMLGFAHFIEEVQTRTGPQRNRIGLSQSFPWPGKLALAGESALYEAEAMWAKVHVTRLALERRIKHAWFDFAFLGQAIRIEEENMRLLKQLEPIVQRRIQGGAGQEDLLRLQVEIGKLENALLSLRKFGPTIRARLNAELGRATSAEIPTPELVAPEQLEFVAKELALRVGEANPELLALRQKIVSAGKRVELAKLDTLPDFRIGADWFDTGSAKGPGTSGSGDDPLAVSIQLNIPIRRKKYAAARRQAEHERRAASQLLVDRQNQLHADLELYLYEIDDAARQLVLYRDTLLPRARQAFEVVRAAYRAGRASMLDVIDAERVLLMFEKAYWKAASSWEKSLADLEAICGGEIR